MYASVQHRPLSYAALFRACGRVGGIIVMVSWLAYFVTEAFRQGAPAPDSYVQAGALSVVFAGYIIGWWKELLGGAMAVAGTIAFYFLVAGTLGWPPQLNCLWLAAPGVCYLVARYLEQHRQWQS